ncbi:wax ester/triacylglycerol synthase family O-acyltransferase [Marinobacter sp. CHS3-4]|uniref:wax ester/triacylglycerol synthase family O-acyltransferase n=1 Tax=Marinobacter sp. CHS3-4 TaxID=3045174 RepID=UPI0024B5189F|nr:wax ester/triacylglycerol synthase family O-acyltransferase [Marinobacter sp. CHS3-4]MDI9245354.1 wax ester/triacylglycerol synthase family O-acyltransferase [Marinobacter sp. CHS3-4]
MTLRKMPLLDAASLQLDGKNMPMHIAALMTFEYPESLDKDDRKTFINELIERWREEPRVEYPWNQVLTRPTRWQLRPVTREIYSLDLEYHLRHWSLPSPGGERELGQMIAWLHEQKMDLEKPLWEVHMIDGLCESRFAVYVKIHHSLVDGVSGSSLVVNSLSSDIESLTTPIWAKKQHDGGEKKVAPKSIMDAEMPTMDDVKKVVNEVKEGFSASQKLRSHSSSGLTTFKATPDCILNGRIGPHRRVATQSIELDRLKKLAKKAEATVNDVVLAIVGGALREYLIDANALPEDSLTAALPVSTRKPGDTSIGNQVTIMYGSLGTNVADPAMRLQYVKQSTKAGKSMLSELSPNAVNAYSLFSTGPFLSTVMLGLNKSPKHLFNTTISNVPGLREPKYLDGAKLLHVFPVSLIMPGLPLNFTCVSHEDHLNFGIVACRDRVPHVQRLAVALMCSMEELEKHIL